MYTHQCIKPGCGNKYQDKDEEPYYCEAHIKEKKAIAAEIDARLAHKTPKRQEPSFEEKIAAMPKFPGTNIPLVN